MSWFMHGQMPLPHPQSLNTPVAAASPFSRPSQVANNLSHKLLSSNRDVLLSFVIRPGQDSRSFRGEAPSRNVTQHPAAA